MRNRLTPEMAARIKWLKKRNPSLHQHEIAALLGCNQGRVSEVLSGKRFGSVSASP